MVVDASRAELPHTGTAKAELIPARLRAQREKRSAWREARRRGWLVRRMLLLADVVGLALAFVRSSCSSARPCTTPRRSDRSDLLLSMIRCRLWIVVAKLYGLYDQRRGARRPLDGRRRRRRLPPRHGRRLARSSSRPRDRGSPDPSSTKLVDVLGARDRASSTGRAIARARLPRAARVRPEHAHRRRRRRRPADRAQAPAAPGVRHQPRRLRRRASRRSCRARPRATCRVLGAAERARRARPHARRRARRSSPSRTTGDEQMLELVRALHDARRPDRHRPAAVRGRRPERRRSTRSRGCRSSALPPRAALAASSRLLKRAIDIVVASVGAARSTAPLFALHRVADQARLARARCSSARRGSGMDMRAFTALKFRTMRVGHRRRRAPRVHRGRRWTRGAAPSANGLYKLERDDAITPSAAGCARRASTSCRS